MGPKEIAVEYRTASNKMTQIRILAELNQCSERRIAEILRDEGAELPHKWQIQLQKPALASRKFPESEDAREDADRADGEAPIGGCAATSPGWGSLNVAAETAEGTRGDEGSAKRVGSDPRIAPETAEGTRGDEGIAPYAKDGEKPKGRPLVFEEIPVAPHDADEARRWADGVGPVRGELMTVRASVDVEELLRAACSLLQDALPLEPEKFRSYAAGVLDLTRRVTEKEG